MQNIELNYRDKLIIKETNAGKFQIVLNLGPIVKYILLYAFLKWNPQTRRAWRGQEPLDGYPRSQKGPIISFRKTNFKTIRK